MKPKHHSHYGSYSKNRYYDDLATEKSKPTAKQKKFFAALCAMCHENNIDVSTGHSLRNRVDYALAINTLISRLNESGIDVHGNGKNFTHCHSYGTDDRGRDFTTERMVRKDEEDAEDAS